MRSAFILARIAACIAILLFSKCLLAQSCNLPLEGGTTITQNPLSCPGSYYLLQVTNGSSGSGLTYSWQQSVDSINWKDVPGKNTATAGFPNNTGFWYRRSTTCVGNGTVYSSPLRLTATPLADCYCTPYSMRCDSQSISRVEIGSLNQSSGCEGGYSNYAGRATIPNVKAGTYEHIKVTATKVSGFRIYILIDANQNGTFETSEVASLPATSAVSYEGNFKVAHGAKPGITRLRIFYTNKVVDNALFLTCSEIGDGEVEDYQVNVLANTTAAKGFRLYVKPQAPGSDGSGSSWENAMTSVKLAVASAGHLDSVFVAQGQYNDVSTDAAGILITDSIQVFGGFPSTGNPTFADRSPALYPSIVSGIRPGNAFGSNFSIFSTASLSRGSVVDGLIIDGSRGAGQTGRIGLLGRYNASVIFRNCVFRNYAIEKPNPIYPNLMSNGIMVTIDNAEVQFQHCVFAENQLFSLIPVMLKDAIITFQNSLIAKNYSYFNFINADSTILTFENTTIAGNTSNMELIFLKTGSKASFTNAIAASNAQIPSSSQHLSYDSAIVLSQASSLISDHSFLQTLPQNNFFGLQVKFKDTATIAGRDGVLFTSDDGFSLVNPCSQAIDKGSNSLASNIVLDLAGKARIYGSTIDLGAYEIQEQVAAIPKVLYVNASATGKKDGSSWQDAFTNLHDALQACSDTIKVAAGTYDPWLTGLKRPYWIEDARVIMGGYPNTGNPKDADRDKIKFPTLITTSTLNFPLAQATNLTNLASLDGLSFGNTTNSFRSALPLLYFFKCRNAEIRNCRFTNATPDFVFAYQCQGLSMTNCILDTIPETTPDNNEYFKFINCIGTRIDKCDFIDRRNSQSYTGDGYSRLIKIDGGDASVENCHFENNQILAIDTRDATLKISKTSFTRDTKTLYTPYYQFLLTTSSTLDVSYSDFVNIQNYSGIGVTHIKSIVDYQNCRFSGFGEITSGKALKISDSTNIKINKCVLEKSSNPISLLGGSSLTLQNSVLSNNSTDLRSGLVQAEASNVSISGISVVNTDRRDNSPMINCIGGGSLSIYNSIFWKNYGSRYLVFPEFPADEIGYSYPSVRVDSLIQYNSFESFSPGGTNIKGIDPRFVNYRKPAGDDNIWGTLDDGLRLCNCSPFIDKGTNLYKAGDFDIDDQPRIVNNQIDLGAYEFNGGQHLVTGKVFVRPAATGKADGASWSNAYGSLHTALKNACADSIYVAAGTYYPAVYARDSVFNIDRNMSIHGSYDPSTGKADVDRHPSILSGDLGIKADSSDNSYILAQGYYLDSIKIDGLVFSNANSISVRSAALPLQLVKYFELSNSRFVQNYQMAGSLVINSVNVAVIKRSVFSQNGSILLGKGGALNYAGRSGQLLSLEHCVFEDNKASEGGAIFTDGGLVYIDDCVFKGNRANYGGAFRPSSAYRIFNSSFVNNYAFRNVGTAIYGRADSIFNSIFIGGYDSSSVPPYDWHMFDLVYSGNINDASVWRTYYSASTLGKFDPSRVAFQDINNPRGKDGIWFTSDDGLQLVACSQGVDEGTNARVRTTQDLAYNNRIINGTVDIGAYEFTGGQILRNTLLDKPNDSLKANKELTDTLGWTHYFADCTWLLSVKKNGRAIGKVGDAGFAVTAYTGENYGKGYGRNITSAVFNISGKPWFAINRGWVINSNVKLIDSLQVRLPFTNKDMNDVKGSNPAVVAPSDLNVFSLNGVYRPFELSASATTFRQYSSGNTATLKDWVTGQEDSFAIADFYISNYGSIGIAAAPASGAPDLTFNTVTLNNQSPRLGDSLKCTFAEKNLDAVNGAGSHRVKFYLSTDSVLSTGDMMIGDYFIPSLAASTSTGNITVTMLVNCNIAAGNYYLIAFSDADNSVAESNESNNQLKLAFTIQPGLPAPAIPVVTMSADDICIGDSAILKVTSAQCNNCIYSWSNGQSGDSIMVKPSASTNYTVIASAGCEKRSNTILLKVTSLPVIGSVGSYLPTCVGDTISLNVYGANVFSWSGTGMPDSSGSVVNAKVAAAGSNFYIVTGTSGPCSSKDTIVVVGKPKPQIKLNTTDTTICLGTTANLVANGATAYSWSPATALNQVTGNSVIASPSTGISYTVTGTQNGCTGMATVKLSVSNLQSPDIAIAVISCDVTAVEYEAKSTNAGIQPRYEWYVDGVLQSSVGNRLTIKNPKNGMQVYANLITSQPCTQPSTVSSVVDTISCLSQNTTGIDGLEAISIQPNPGNGLFQVKLKTSSQLQLNFIITDANGVLVRQLNSQLANGDYNTSFDLRGLSGGVYYLYVQVGSSKLALKLVLVP